MYICAILNEFNIQIRQKIIDIRSMIKPKTKLRISNNRRLSIRTGEQICKLLNQITYKKKIESARKILRFLLIRNYVLF